MNMKSPMKMIPVVLALALLSGCATAPEKVASSYVSELAYQTYSCEQLCEEYARLNAALRTAAQNQRKVRAGDKAGVIFLGLPVASISGNNQAQEIARLKGEYTAIEKAAKNKGCALPELIDPMTPPTQQQ